jgi:two-component system response regulator VicR
MSERYKVLVIEDDLSISNVVELNLKLDGYQVFLAFDGEEGLRMVKEVQPDLVILDVMMPKVDGWEVLTRLRQDEQTRDMPVIMLTAVGDDQSRVMGLRGGADDYVTKPFNPLELTARVKVILDRVGKATKLAERQVEEEQEIKLDQIPVQRGDAILLIPMDDIVYIDTKYEYANVHTHDTNYMTNYHLAELEKILDRSVFFRTHRSYIVNLRKVKEIVRLARYALLLVMNDQKESKIPVSRRQAVILKELLGI